MSAQSEGKLVHTWGMADAALPMPSWSVEPARLDGISLLHVVEYFAFGERSGRLELRGSGRTRILELQPGRIHRFLLEDGDMEERAARVLVAQEIITTQEADRAQDEALRSGARLSYRLFLHHRLSAGQIVRAFRQAQRELLLGVLEEKEGSFRFTPQEAFDSPPDAVETDPRALFVGLLRDFLVRQDREALLAALSPLGDDALRADGERLARSPWLYLRPKELAALERGMNGEHSVLGLARAVGLEEADGLRLVHLLAATRVLPVSLPASRGAALPSEEERQAIARTRHRLEEILQEKTAGDHFEALGLQWTCHPIDIRAAHEALRGRFGPGSRVRAIPGCESLAEAIWARMNEAVAVLSDGERRYAYRTESVGQERMAAAARFLGQKAEEAYRAEPDKAIRLIECAIDLDGGVWEYNALRAKFLRG